MTQEHNPKVESVYDEASLTAAIVNRIFEEHAGMSDVFGDAGEDYEYEIGHLVQVVDGPLNTFIGAIEAIDAESEKMTIRLNMFGRDCEVRLCFDKVIPCRVWDALPA
jgi:transcription antitermination factor NusG